MNSVMDIFDVILGKHLYKQTLEHGEDVYLNEEELPICKKCNTPRYLIHEDDGKTYYLPVWCKCQEVEAKKIEEEKKIQERISRFKARQKMSALGERYFECRFDNSIINDKNKKTYSLCSGYVAKWEDVKAKNIGLYIYGPNSTGKTHLTACIVNALVERGINVLCTSVPKILTEIYQSWDGDGGLTENEVIRKLANTSLVVIDDLGKEFLGRETNKGKSKYAEKILLEILNARYNNKKPTIFSSNYSIADLKKEFDLDDAIMERISEMSTIIIKLEGENFRRKERETKSEEAEKLLGGL